MNCDFIERERKRTGEANKCGGDPHLKVFSFFEPVPALYLSHVDNSFKESDNVTESIKFQQRIKETFIAF